MKYGKQDTSRKKEELTSKSVKRQKKSFVAFVKVACIIAVTICVAGGGVAFGIINGIISNAPDVSWDEVAPSGAATLIYDVEGVEIERLAASSSNRIYVSLDKIPDALQKAVVAVEDERFYEHNGIDVKGIARAFFVNITSGDLSEGASTITQQLLKNSVFTNWTNESSLMEKFERKFQEQYLAVMLEQTLSKDVILENYLNTVNFGAGAYGVQAAAHVYFDKDVSELTLSEATVIAGITQNPTAFNPFVYPENNAIRREMVLDHMLSQGYITETQHAETLADDVYARLATNAAEADDNSVYTYFTDELIEQVVNDLMEERGYTREQAEISIYNGGLRIYTTQDAEIQAIMDDEFSDESNFPSTTEWYLEYQLTILKSDGTQEHHSKEMLREYFRTYVDENFTLLFADQQTGLQRIEEYKKEVMEPGDEVFLENAYFTAQPQASMVIIDHATGHVVAMVGGRGTKETSLSLNRATQSLRQPGSTFKILSTYAPALESYGKTLATTYNNAPYTYSDGTPLRNWDSDTNTYSGYTTIREAIEQSINVVAVEAMEDISVDVAYEWLEKFKFTTLSDQDKVQSLSLGGITDGVSNLELAASYAAIANQGTYIEPIYYTKITDQSGNVILEKNPEENTETIIKESTAYLLTNAMEDVVTGANGTGTALNIGSMPVAGKTGTTNDYKDIWFTGYTPYYTASIWTGYDNNDVLSNFDSYRTYNKTLWQKIMQRIHEDLPAASFQAPTGSIKEVQVCAKSGLLPIQGVCEHDPRGSMVYTEYFESGTEPTTQCDKHSSVSVCSVSNRAANSFCPNTKTMAFMSLSAEEAKDTDDANYLLPGPCNVHSKPAEKPKQTESDDDDDDDDGDINKDKEKDNETNNGDDNSSNGNDGNSGDGGNGGDDGGGGDDSGGDGD